MNTSTTIELLLETVFSALSVQSGYKEDNWGAQSVEEFFCLSAWGGPESLGIFVSSP
jgi:hypothetical protein